MDLSATIKELALAAGFDLVGIVSLDSAPQSLWNDLNFARRWVDTGHGGEMYYLANPKRDDPRRVLPSVQSVICVGLVYNSPLPYSTEVGEISRQKAVGTRQKAEGRRQDDRQVSSFDFRFSALQAEGGRQDPVGSGQKTEGGVQDKGQVSNFEFPVSNFQFPVSSVQFPVSNTAWISRYAWGHDYHHVMRAKLEQLRAELERLASAVETRVYVDTGPIVERVLARYSGIGWVAKNTCLINQEKGSWFFLGTILTNLALAPDIPAPDRCGSCTRCLEACPTGALIEPYVMDASRCISYFTIELKGSIPLAFRAALGRNIFGCDICQDVCPWNGRSSDQWQVASGQWEGSSQDSASSSQPRRAATTDRTEFQPLQVVLHRATAASSQPLGNPAPSASFSLFNPPLEALASLSDEDFRQVFSRSPIKRAKFRGWLRNLCVAMGNSGNAQFVPWLERACQYPDATVREHAEWALSRLQETGSREHGD
jgi:epoxyqueuosine reductase